MRKKNELTISLKTHNDPLSSIKLLFVIKNNINEMIINDNINDILIIILMIYY